MGIPYRFGQLGVAGVLKFCFDGTRGDA